MKTEKNILIAFLLNVSFSIFELIGGILTNSVAIMSDAIHDFGDATSIGISYFLEKKSKKKPDAKYTYGYIRYSVLGAFITSSVLIIGSIIIIIGAINRLINPVEINYDGMIIFAIFGVAINFLAAYFTREGDSLNQKSVNLHMLEDVLGWVIVLIGSIVIKFTKINTIDSIMSIGVALFILINALKSIKAIFNLFLEKVPTDINIEKIEEALMKIKNVKGVHHIHVWSIDGFNNYATMHVVTDDENDTNIKNAIKKKLKENKISHVTIEIEKSKQICKEKECKIDIEKFESHHHNH